MDELVSSGIDALNSIDVTAGMDIVKVRKKYPGLVMVGGIDSIWLLARSKPGDVEMAILEILIYWIVILGFFLGQVLKLIQKPGCKIL